MYANVLEKEILLFFRGFLGLSAVVVAVVFLHALEPLCFAVKLDCFEFIFAFFALLERFTFFSLSLHAILFAIMKCACAFYFFFRNYVFLFVSTDCLCLCACSISFAIIIRLWIHWNKKRIYGTEKTVNSWILVAHVCFERSVFFLDCFSFPLYWNPIWCIVTSSSTRFSWI